MDENSKYEDNVRATHNASDDESPQVSEEEFDEEAEEEQNELDDSDQWEEVGAAGIGFASKGKAEGKCDSGKNSEKESEDYDYDELAYDEEKARDKEPDSQQVQQQHDQTGLTSQRPIR